MNFKGNQTKDRIFYKAIGKQVVLFSLLVTFINTIVFPSFFLVVKHSSLSCQISATPECASSLTEYLLEDYLEVYDSTSDTKEEDIKDLEKLFDEVDLLNYPSSHMAFHQGVYTIKKYAPDKYPLRVFCYSSPTPPPEC